MGGMFEPQSDGDRLLWLSARPAEQGRTTIVSWDPAKGVIELLPAPWNARSRVNEYGGGAYCVVNSGICFSNFDDGRIYHFAAGATPLPLTCEGPFRFGDLTYDQHRDRLICIREDHTFASAGVEQKTELVSIDLATSEIVVLANGADFYASPRLSPDGERLAWVSWNHPNMPWDYTDIFRATINAKGMLEVVQREPSPTPQARMQPQWSDKGDLYFISDSDGWWNLHTWPKDGSPGKPVTRIVGEIGGPSWVLGMRQWAVYTPESAKVLYTADGYWHAATVDLLTGELIEVSAAFALLSSLTVVGNRTYVTGSTACGRSGLFEYCDGSLTHRCSSVTAGLSVEAGDISVASHFRVPLPNTADTGVGEECFAWLYLPINKNCKGLPGERPPVIVQFHGGPTAASSSAYSLRTQFWTNRGIAFLDINYRGSTGYGRAYRHRLYGGYGILDVEDAVATLKHVAAMGLVDESRAIIMGASSGGFTVLATMAASKVFSGGINIFGVADLELFLQNPHKFESRCLHTIVGDWNECPGLLAERSPITHLAQIRRPLLTFQGSADRVVPPDQSHVIVNSLRERGVPCVYIEFEGEGHGFRRAESVEAMLNASLAFCGAIMGFTPADELEPLHFVPPLP